MAAVFASNYYLQCKVALDEVSHLPLPWLPARGTAQDQGSRLAVPLLWLLEIFRYRTQFLSSTEAGKSFSSEMIFNPHWIGIYPANSLYKDEGQIQHLFKLLVSHRLQLSIFFLVSFCLCGVVSIPTTSKQAGLLKYLSG